MRFSKGYLWFAWPLIITLSQSAWAQTPTEQNRSFFFQKGVDAYEAAKYKDAFEAWLPLAKAGDAPAARNLGYLYDNGFGVPKDITEALRWYARAADGGSASAQYRAGMMVLQGQGTNQNIPKAIDYLTKAATAGEVAAQYNLGVIYQKGIGVPADPEQAKTWFYNAASGGHDKAKSMIQNLSQPSISPPLTKQSILPEQKVSSDMEDFMKESNKPSPPPPSVHIPVISPLSVQTIPPTIQSPTPIKQTDTPPSAPIHQKTEEPTPVLSPIVKDSSQLSSQEKQKLFNERETKDKSIITMNDNLQARGNPYFFSTELETKSMPLLDKPKPKEGQDPDNEAFSEKNLAGAREANLRRGRVGNPYDPVYSNQKEAFLGSSNPQKKPEPITLQTIDQTQNPQPTLQSQAKLQAKPPIKLDASPSTLSPLGGVQNKTGSHMSLRDFANQTTTQQETTFESAFGMDTLAPSSAPASKIIIPTDLKKNQEKSTISPPAINPKKAYEEGDYTVAVKEWEKQASTGNAKAHFWLGKAYAEGKGVRKDTLKAYAHWKTAKRLGSPEAAAALTALQSHMSDAELYKAETTKNR